LSPRTGRPLSDNPRQERVETKITKDELEKLDHCCRERRKAPRAAKRGRKRNLRKMHGCTDGTKPAHRHKKPNLYRYKLGVLMTAEAFVTSGD